jgi:hypothetical protein
LTLTLGLACLRVRSSSDCVNTGSLVHLHNHKGMPVTYADYEYEGAHS